MNMEEDTNMSNNQTDALRILAVFPHPDDESFVAAGTLAKYIAGGAQVTFACLTLGEMGRNMGIPPFANRVTLPGIRKRELEDSCRAIGIQDLRMLGFHDKMLEFEDQELLDGTILDMLQELKPSIVITFYPGYSVHPDHDATGAAVIRTIGRLPAEERPVVLCSAFSSNHEQMIGKADVTVDVTAFLSSKMASIQSHRSQFQAAELVGSRVLADEEIRSRYGTEQFWTYRFS
ncbi:MULTISPECIES: bacillithiol biosynthesis deacetylase BshB2 [unclassified Paenibacillus]|uniref:bacillithiol biosynthesis deacetylase BshB2 n=1 Tax=unclassified Paenibacillus TaxID=185978 RepID=UPI002406F817|nr:MULTISPECIES: bacillithiol biosynthesis deacetylase BshB2 [unclassified Paenibacillus]MDF9839338.1 bacillithiol biosynthesis deacetylase BshB2 [Paenibacillus sp. PastF-2]MDF9845919.1 bacillithiol biosynthesis deacetylase BshB2 [Paenibacillus sp. PastM-2]MDF9852492.1 bacillithiol biosynthesis deacetylase BshB2 [Paenibacillus sp. PastF-1]MDH6477778.1 bacillithiol biosynthesis deacetylase BshB2 [Paenibacillus sp. PastH-2]MDH6505517.1 bacillithiol biosynthesis deacetylase BshB2 [Paenibacillus s